jgi:hypothetical protein
VFPPTWFNERFVVLPPQGDSERDHVEIVRTPKDTRPLNLKNSDTKLVGSSVNERIIPCVASWGHFAQRGFVRGWTATPSAYEDSEIGEQVVAKTIPCFAAHPPPISCSI